MITQEEIDNIDLSHLTGPLKRVALIHDLSGFGKASLTVSLPILAAAGIEGVCLPTALLSTHTGEFKNFTYKDLTSELPKILAHWDSFGLTFNAIYSGYLSSPEQVEFLIDFIQDQKSKNSNLTVFIDPVMGDNGDLYKAYKQSLIQKNRTLIKQADVILPNMTECYFLLDETYKQPPYSEEEIKRTAEKLNIISKASVIITGIELSEKEIGVAVFNQGNFNLIRVKRISGKFHGTGDVFASFLLGAYLNGIPLNKAASLASVMVYYAAKRTEKRDQPRRDGLDFEGTLPLYIKEIKKLK